MKIVGFYGYILDTCGILWNLGLMDVHGHVLYSFSAFRSLLEEWSRPDSQPAAYHPHGEVLVRYFKLSAVGDATGRVPTV